MFPTKVMATRPYGDVGGHFPLIITTLIIYYHFFVDIRSVNKKVVIYCYYTWKNTLFFRFLNIQLTSQNALISNTLFDILGEAFICRFIWTKKLTYSELCELYLICSVFGYLCSIYLLIFLESNSSFVTWGLHKIV